MKTAAIDSAARERGGQADLLTTHAERLYPQCPYLQREWLRAVRVVRGTRRGWVLDRTVQRAGAAQ